MTESLPPNPANLALAARLDRIDADLDAVKGELQVFIDADSYALRKYFDTKAREYVYRAQVLAQPPAAISILIGEFLHNASATLDNLAWIVSNGCTVRGHSFPIFKTRDEYRRPWTRNSGYYATRDMPVEAQGVIEDEQPYHRGHGYKSHPLWMLRQLSNADKHRALHLCGAAVQRTEFSVPVEDGVKVPAPKFWRGPFVDGGVVARQGIPVTEVAGQGEAHMKLRLAFAVAFAEDGPGLGANVEMTLFEMRNAVWGIAKRLQPFLRWETPPPPIPPPPHEMLLD